MTSIVRGTTPTITFEFSSVDVSLITVAYLTIKNATTTVLSKDITSATKTATTMSWTLSQQESFLLTAGQVVNVCCDWKLSTGTRGRSVVLPCKVEDTGKGEVI